MGILSLALGVGGLAAYGGLLHAVNNALNKGVVFLAVGNVLQATGTSEARQVTGLLQTMPWTAGFLVAGFFAATGFPPFGTFISEFTILRGHDPGRPDRGRPSSTSRGSRSSSSAWGASCSRWCRGSRPPDRLRARREGDASSRSFRSRCSSPLVVVLGLHVPEPLRDLLVSASGVKGGGG